MRLSFYARKSEPVGKQLEKIMQMAAPEERIEIHRSIRSLCQRLRRPYLKPFLILVFAADQKDLLDVLSIRDLLRDVPMVLVLPDDKKETVALAHRLRPRFLAHIGGMIEVGAVLERMLKRYNRE